MAINAYTVSTAINGEPNTTGVYTNTTDATQTTAATFLTRDDHAYSVRARITATETTDHDEVAYYERAALFNNDGGTLSLVGSITSLVTIESTAGWDVTLDASGDTIRARVTGASSTNITWLVQLDITEVGQYFTAYGPKD